MLSWVERCFGITLLSILFFTTNNLFAQFPATGFEIESILVDGCDGGNEGKNEMVIFRNGPVALDINSIRVDGAGSTGTIVNGDWPSGNNFLGFCTTVGASTNISNLDAAIVKCGRLLEPPLGIIPPNKKVLIMTSTDFTAVPTYFENLTDTLYVVLQCVGNVSGHFVNYNSTSSFRTLVLTNTLTGYADTVLYDRSLLVDGSGVPGNGDGGAVSYTWAGVASYFNNGCQAPFVPISVGYAPVGTADCITNTFSLSGSVMSGSYKEIFWTGGTGTFSASNSLNTDYTPGIGELGNDTLTFNAVDYCNDTTSIEIPIVIYPLPISNAGDDISICSGNSSSLGTVTNPAFSYSWSPLIGLSPDGTVSNPSVTLTNTSSIPITSTYTVTTTVIGTGCNSSNDVNVTVTSLDNASFTITPNCNGATVSNVTTPNGTFSFYTTPLDDVIINNSDGTITNGTSGSTYEVMYLTNICSNSFTQNVTIPTTPSPPGSNNDTITYCSNDPKADLIAYPSIGGNIIWYSDSMLTTILGIGNTLPIINTNGSSFYYVTETESTNGCEGESKTIRITINECDIIIPTAITPNNDNIDDVWELNNLDAIFPKNIVRIYNRWGNLVFESVKGMYEKSPWDGNSNGSSLPIAAYYFVIEYNKTGKVDDTGTICIIR